jgi:hypothetical protein
LQPTSGSGGYGFAGGPCDVDIYDGGGGGAGGAGNIDGQSGVGRSADVGTGTFAAGGFGKDGTEYNTNGAANTGDGGAANNGNGGSGIIRIRYQFQA